MALFKGIYICEPFKPFDTGGEEISLRLIHCLVNEGCTSLDDALAKERDPKWHGGRGRKEWQRTPNLGPKSYKELCGLLERHEKKSRRKKRR